MITIDDLDELQRIQSLLDLELAECISLDADHPLITAANDIDLFLDDYERGKATYLSLFTVCQNALDALESVL